MKPRSPRTLRIIYSTAAVFTMIVCFVNFYQIIFVQSLTNDMCQWEHPAEDRDTYVITRVIEDGVADEAGIQVGDTLVSINGVNINSKQPGYIIREAKAGESMIYRLRRNGTIYTTYVEVVKTMNYVYIALFLLGFGFLVVGWAVFMTKPQGEIQRRFARFSLLSMAFFGMHSPALAAFGMNWWYWMTLAFVVIVHIEAPVQFVSFFCHFPVKKRLAAKRWFIPSLYALALLLIGIFLLSVFDIIIPSSGPTAQIIRAQIWSSPLYFYTIGLALFAHSYFRRVEKDARHKLRHILFAILQGAAAFAYLIYVSYTDALAFIFFPLHAAPAFFVIGAPLAFGYSIIRFRLMDVDLIIKRSLIYASITATVAAIYLLIVIGIGNIIGGLFGDTENEVLTIIAIVVIAFLFDPIKRMAQQWIDKIFYQDRINYQKALLEFSRELPGNIDLEHILSSMVSRISSTMHVDKAAVLLCHEQEGCRDASMNMNAANIHFSMEADGLASYLRKTRTALPLAIPQEDFQAIAVSDSDKELLRKEEIDLVVPMFYKDVLLGTILVGPKLSGKLFSQEDIDLLSTVASQAAIAIENSRLYIAEVERQKITEELNIARRIQLGLLPQGDPLIRNLDISGVSIPAQSVGGDYFDYITLDDGRLLIVVADVSGKGIPAALYMSKVQGMIRVAAGDHHSPREILIHVNRYIHERFERNAFITIALALFDTSNNTVKICRAGHTKPILKLSGKTEFINPKGMGLGLEEGPTFDATLEERSYTLSAGDSVILYSDGLTESMDLQMEEFGEERLFESITSRTSLDARTLQDEIISDAHTFSNSAPQHDDLTLVVVNVK
jgi:phosphoserine phosphatase RsbU/P